MVRRSPPAKFEAERRFPVRIRVTVPPCGFGEQLSQFHSWLDAVAGRENYAVHAAHEPSLPDAVFFYFCDVAAAQAFVERFERSAIIVS